MALPPLGRTWLTDHSAGPALGNTIRAKRVANMLDGQASQLVAFAADGSVRWVAGRGGEGPGEFDNARGLALSGDSTLAIVNRGSNRLDFWDTSGEYLRSGALNDPSLDFEGARILLVLVPVLAFAPISALAAASTSLRRSFCGLASVVLQAKRLTRLGVDLLAVRAFAAVKAPTPAATTLPSCRDLGVVALAVAAAAADWITVALATTACRRAFATASLGVAPWPLGERIDLLVAVAVVVVVVVEAVGVRVLAVDVARRKLPIHVLNHEPLGLRVVEVGILNQEHRRVDLRSDLGSDHVHQHVLSERVGEDVVACS